MKMLRKITLLVVLSMCAIVLSARQGPGSYVYYGMKYRVIDSLIISGDNISAISEANAMLREATADSSDYGRGLADFCLGRVYTIYDNDLTAVEYLRSAIELLSPMRDSLCSVSVQDAIEEIRQSYEVKAHTLQSNLYLGRTLSAITIPLILLSLVFVSLRANRRLSAKNAQLYAIIRQSQEKEEAVAAAITSDVARKDDRSAMLYARLCELMHDENVFSTPLDRSSLAAKLGTNTNYLAEAVHLYGGGRTINEYIKHSRLAYAARLLTDATESTDIEELWERCGFTSRSTFFRQFKDEYGMSPTEYQKAANK